MNKDMLYIIWKLEFYIFWKLNFWVPQWYPDLSNLKKSIIIKQKLWVYAVISGTITGDWGTTMVPKNYLFKKFNISAFICRVWCKYTSFRSNFKDFWNSTFWAGFNLFLIENVYTNTFVQKSNLNTKPWGRIIITLKKLAKTCDSYSLYKSIIQKNL